MLSIFFLTCFSEKAFSSHLYGGELFYTHVSGNTYTIKLILYADCSGEPGALADLAHATPGVSIYNGTSLINTVRLSLIAGSEEDVTPVCNAFKGKTSCSPGGTVSGVKRYSYATTITLNTTSKNWRFRTTGVLGTSSAGRSNSITNIVVPALGSLMILEATLNNTVNPNSNPSYTTIPTPFFCINVPQEYNQGAVDPNTKDSLVYTLVAGLEETGGTVTYLPSYSATAPLATVSGSFSFSNNTGQLNFTPNLTQKSLVVSKVSEYSDGVLVGTSMREMTFIVLSTCSTPSADWKISDLSSGLISGHTVSICKEAAPALSFNIKPSVTSDTLFADASGLPDGAKLIFSGSGTPTPSGSFYWDISSVVAGTYYFFITYQGNGCPISSKQTVAYTINIVPKPSATVNVITPVTCVRKAVVDIIPAGGSAPWSIDVFSGTSLLHTLKSSSGTIQDSFAVGTYIFNIVNSTGCTGQSQYIVNPPPLVGIFSFKANSPSCNGVSNGSAVIVGSGGLPPFEYSIDSGAFNASGTFTGLSAGKHKIQIRDANFCTRDTIFTLADITEITLASSINKPLCNPYHNGAFGVVASGGMGPYSYAFSTAGVFDSVSSWSELSSGIYIIKVRDALNCIKEFPVTVKDSIILESVIIIKNASCFGNTDGQITLLPYIGKPPFTFAIDSRPYSTTSSFNSLSANNYAIHIKDDMGCVLDTPLAVGQPTALKMSLLLKMPSCFESSDGGIEVKGSGGSGDYTFSVNAGLMSVEPSFTSLKAGVHKVTIRDSKGCSTDTTATLTEPGKLYVKVDSIAMPVCYGGANGFAQITGSGGTPDYRYSYGSGVPSAKNLLTGLAAGRYNLIVTDQNGCKKDTSVIIGQPAQLVFENLNIKRPTCEGYADGSVMPEMSNGTEPYVFGIDNLIFSPDNPIRNLKEGTYTIYARDSNNCQADISVDLVGYPKIALDNIQTSTTSCYGISDGAITLLASGGNSPLRYTLQGRSDTGTIASFKGLKAKTYTISVIDNKNCIKTYDAIVGEPEKLKVITELIHNDCTGSDTSGRITALVQGGTTPYQYSWKGGTFSADSVLSSLANGFYSLRVRDAHGCTDTFTSEIHYDNCCKPGIPNAFTPNNDGKNDLFHIIATGGALKEFSIYNRYGQQVFTTDNINQGWDGRFQNKEAEMGVYYYYVRLICGNLQNREVHFKGDITLVR